jgi:tetratricopeptide (TPR) repeat protein
MAHAIESRTNSPANDLRDALDRAERQVVQLDASNIESFLVLLDQIDQQFELLAPTTDLRPEESRWESLLNRIASRPGPLVAVANKVGGLAALRAKHPPAASFWWQLDAQVAKQRMQMLRRVLITLVTIAVVIGGGLWAINFFFPPDPRAVLLVNANADVEQLVMVQDWAGALEVVERAQQELPDEPELVIWEAVLAEQLGDLDRAQAALDRARTLLPDQPVEYWVMVGNNRLLVGNLTGAEEAANQALALAPEDPQATFLLGSVAETKGDTPTAIALFNRVFELAEESNPQLAVIARVRMGNLLQRMDPFAQAGTVTETETLTTTGTVTTP